MWRGQPAERPYVLLAQQSLVRSRAARRTASTRVWAYCHVPHGSTCDMTERIEAQIERFAPGFRDRVLARHVVGPAAMERYNPNYIGGDINGGVQDLFQHFTRPVAARQSLHDATPGLFICSSSTPPGGGVHGMCGYFAARAVLKKGTSNPPEGILPLILERAFQVSSLKGIALREGRIICGRGGVSLPLLTVPTWRVTIVHAEK